MEDMYTDLRVERVDNCMFYVQYRKSINHKLIKSNLHCYLISDVLAKILSKPNGFCV